AHRVTSVILRPAGDSPRAGKTGRSPPSGPVRTGWRKARTRRTEGYQARRCPARSSVNEFGAEPPASKVPGHNPCRRAFQALPDPGIPPPPVRPGLLPLVRSLEGQPFAGFLAEPDDGSLILRCVRRPGDTQWNSGTPS